MIGLYLHWDRNPVAPDIVRRFTASLGAGHGRPIGHQASDGALLAGLCRTPAEARGWQPIAVPSGGRLLFDGYIDNADALRRELGIAPCSAGELYAAGYARWGDAVDLRAIGQFATVLVLPEGRGVRCVRSPLHAPPLHLWHDHERVIVASLARAIPATGAVPEEIDEQKVADSLYLNYADAARGWYKGVARLPTGHRLVITPNGGTARRYYDLGSVPRVRMKRDADYVEAASALFAEGTRAALQGFSQPAVSLSGGLDSQAVAAFAIEALGERPLLGLTAVPEPGWHGEDPPKRFGDERHHAAALAAMYPSLRLETIDAAGLSFDHRLDAMFLMGGIAPRNAMNLHWIHALRARAKALGCDVLLLGTMGNHSFSFDGSGALPAWLARGNWLRLARELRATRRRSFVQDLVSRAVLPLLPERLSRHWVAWRSGPFADPLDQWSPLNRDYAEQMRVRERARDLGYDADYRPVRSPSAHRRAAMENAMHESGDLRQALELIHGIPARDPTAYRPLVEFCVAIPHDQYLRDGQSRWLARRMLRNRIPELVRNETRRGRQSADWALRIARERPALLRELEALSGDPTMAQRLDLPRLKAALAAWSPDAPQNAETINLIELALPRATATARFIRFVEGTNR